MWSKADVVGATPKKPIPSQTSISPSSISQPSSKRNGKHVLSDAVVKSDPDEGESGEESSEKSRFSDSEDDQ
jgi:hypothetical protein